MIKSDFKYILSLIFLFSFSILFSQKKDLPLIVEKFDSSKYLVFHITGDGGWRGYDIKLADEFKANKMSYIFLNAFKYFWSTKTPDQLAKDIVPVLSDSLKTWNKKELIIVGFSFGAEIIPFLFTRLPEELKQKVRLLVLITPAKTSDLTIHITDMLGVDHDYAYNVVNEVEKIKTAKVLAIFGEKETSIFSEKYKQENLKVIFIKGGHHFTDAKAVMEIILQELK